MFNEKEYNKKYWKKNKEILKIKNKIWREKNSNYVKEKKKEWWKIWYPKNKIKVNQRTKLWYEKNREYCLQYHKDRHKKTNYNKKWRDNNREKYRKWFREYSVKLRKNPKFRLNQSIASGINKALKGKKAGRKWETVVGYTLQDLSQHLEKQFDNKMNWDNYGSYWHIDHIVPQSWFPYQTVEEQAFKDCWELVNLQPMEKFKNLSKCNRYNS